MKVIKATQQMLETRTLVLGFQGENLRTQLRIDCSPTFAEYPNATPALAVKPSSGETYPVFVERDGNEVVWDIVANNLVLKGDGELQLTFYKDNVIAKTVIGTIRVNRSLQIDGEMPDVVATWIENANRKLAEVDAQIVELEEMVDTATEAAERAEQSASTASTKAEQAAGSAATATAKATEATNAAGTATAKAAEAQLQAQYAINSAQSAAESERIATAKAGEATQAAGTATTKAEQATEAAETATEKAGDASASATAAHASEINAAESADDALSAEVGANAAKTAAETSATQAGTSAQNAGTAAQTATQKAAEATQSATNAATFAGTATTKAEEAAESAQAAQDAKTAVEQTAEQLADSLEQIDQNTQDIAELDERKANVDGYYPDMTVGNAEQLNSSKFVENSEPYTLRPSGGTSDIGNREYVDAVVGVSLPWNQMVRDEASENSTDFADVVTVTDAVEDAAGVKVKLEPVQDLNGYDHPWPGGGGKNLFDKNTQTKPAYINASGNAVSTSAVGWGASDYISVTPGDYIASGYAKVGTDVYMGIYDENKNFVRAIPMRTGNTATTSVTILDGESFVRLSIRNTSGEEDTAQFEKGSTATSYAPYANICPISGFDKVEVWDDSEHGGNVNWNQMIQHGNFDTNSYWYTFNATFTVANGIASITPTSAISRIYRTQDVVLNHKYLMHAEFKGALNKGNAMLSWHGGVNQFVPFTGDWQKVDLLLTNTFQTASNWQLHYGSSANNENAEYQIRNAMCFDLTQMFGEGNEPSTVEEFKALFPADYYPDNEGEITTVGAVNGNPYRHYSITLPTEAGTVYGGELTVNSDGTGTIVQKMVYYKPNSMSELVLHSDDTTHKLYKTANFMPIASNIYGGSGAKSSFTNTFGNAPTHGTQPIVQFPFSASQSYLYFRITAEANPLECEFVYEIASPQTFVLTASQIRTLLGTNNVWADTGDLALTYTGTDEHLTLESGKKYLTRISGTDSMLLGSGQEITAAKGTDNVFDLTKMFGTAVADYVYGQGAAFFRKWFPNAVYPYNAGELKHVEGLSAHEMVGFNLFDAEAVLVPLGFVKQSDGSLYLVRASDAQTATVLWANKSRYDGTICISYEYKNNSGATSGGARFRFDYVDGTYGYSYPSPVATYTAYRTVSNTGKKVKQITYDFGSSTTSTWLKNVCVNFSHNGSRNGEYAPYEKHSYPLDSSVILRGIPKVDANGVYWDGDRYLPDGTIERRYGVVDLGTLNWIYRSSNGGQMETDILSAPAVNGANGICSKYINQMAATGWADVRAGAFHLRQKTLRISDPAYTDAAAFKAAMQGVLLVYELENPTTETAQPYHSTQWVSDWGTEEFVSTGLVPVGHETRYPANLRDKLQHLPDAASGNGSYLITQTDGQMVLTPFPAPPSSAGNYVLKATVTGGVATYTWEVAT